MGAPISRLVVATTAIAVLGSASIAVAGPETALREFAGGQIKKGVRTIGMGGDGATTGNYALVYKEAGGAIFDQGVVRFQDTGNVLRSALSASQRRAFGAMLRFM